MRLAEGDLAVRGSMRWWPTDGETQDWLGDSEVSRASAEYVRWVQGALNRLIGARLKVDGKSGPVTRASIQEFQRRNGIHVDGDVGPETERALIARGAGLPPGTGAAPSPSSSPSPVTGLRSAIARIAREELQRWKNKKETDPVMAPVLRGYWATVGRNYTENQLTDPAFHKHAPWSAAFVSWVMKRAGAGQAFAYSAAHANYVVSAKASRAGNQANRFKAYRISEAVPEPGDVICKGRGPGAVTFDNVKAGIPTHGDIVVGREGNELLTIGGNVSNTVALRRVKVDASGRIADARFFAILKAPEAYVAARPPAAPPVATAPLAGFFKDVPALQNAPLTPLNLVPEPSSEMARALARTYNRLGGLMSALASQLGVEVPAILAVWYVESHGRVHTPGRAVIRFENHVFFNLWGKTHSDVYDRHFRHGGRNGVPGEGRQKHQFRDDPAKPFEASHKKKNGQSHEYRVLGFARRLSDEAALKSISIGGSQIKIENFRMLGYATPLAMYEAFQNSERYHVLGFVDFCARRYKAGGMFKALREHDWRTFARGYNGAGQVEVYAAKLLKAYNTAKEILGGRQNKLERETPPLGPLGGVAAGRAVIDKVPLLQSHRGTRPDLILRWNRMVSVPEAVDVVVHLHGYSSRKAAMRIDRDKEPASGLDFADPLNRGVAGRSAPTLCLLPRGNYFGGRSGNGYNFPALTSPAGLQQLIAFALAQFATRIGVRAVRRRRLIITAHSGGGAALMRILGSNDPDEIHVFDGLYGDATPLVRWARARLARPDAAASALRVLYRPKSGTEKYSKQVANALRSLLPPRDPRSSRWRVEATPVSHGEIPRRFGWRLLRDAASNLPLSGQTVLPRQPAGPGTPAEIVQVGKIRVARPIAPQVASLLAAAQADGIQLSGGGYRSRQSQIALRRKHCGPTDYDIYRKPSNQCHPPTARPGNSMHERGLAIDFTRDGKLIKTRSDPGFRWLSQNADRFGLYNLPSEPWHWSINGR